MKKDKIFGTIFEVEAFTDIYDIKIMHYIFNSIQKNNFEIMLDEYTLNEENKENINNYQSFISKEGFGIIDIKLNNKLCNIETGN
jgi:hypothetical protein